MAAERDTGTRAGADGATVAPETTRFGWLLKSHRTSLGMSQDEVGIQMGVGAQTVGKWERGEKTPQPRFHDKLVNLLGYSNRFELRQDLSAPMEQDTEGDDATVLAFRRDTAEPVPGQVPTTPPLVSPSERALQAAIKIIDAKDGDMSEAEATIVAKLLVIGETKTSL